MRILALALAMVVQGQASAQSLDAPINEHPTVRSEIKRGYDAAALCDKYDIPARVVDPCVQRILTEYQINHPASDAFAVGLNIRKWVIGAKYARLAHDLPDNRMAQDYALSGKVTASQAELDATTGAIKLKITTDQAFEAAGVVPANRPPSVMGQ